MEVNLKKTIVLVGLMGCGKSAIGSRLAKKLDLAFTDIDQAIEEHEGMTVSQIFKEKGEKFFRTVEENTIKEELTKRPPHILASGGGAYINDKIRKIIKKHAISVWIKADFDVLLERVSRKNSRPLLEQGNKAQLLKELMLKRYPIYKEADIIVETTTGSHEIVVNRILEKIANENKQDHKT